MLFCFRACSTSQFFFFTLILLVHLSCLTTFLFFQLFYSFLTLNLVFCVLKYFNHIFFFSFQGQQLVSFMYAFFLPTFLPLFFFLLNVPSQPSFFSLLKSFHLLFFVSQAAISHFLSPSLSLTFCSSLQSYPSSLFPSSTSVFLIHHSDSCFCLLPSYSHFLFILLSFLATLLPAYFIHSDPSLSFLFMYPS